MYRIFFKSLHAIVLKAKQNNQLFVLVYFPQRIQVQQRDWELFRRRWNLNPDDFDLDLHNRRVTKYCRTHGINFLDLTSPFRDAARKQNMYLPNDGHPNQLGHVLAAQVLQEFLSRKIHV